MTDNKTVVSLVPKSTAPKHERCDALTEVKNILCEFEKDNIPYNRAIIVLVSDDTDDPDKAGVRIATINTPGYSSLGLMKIAEISLLERVLS